MKVSITSFGCKINQFDSAALREALVKGGASLADAGDKADVYVVNTCTVTKKSDDQCRQAIRRAIKEKGERGIVVVTGCYASANPEEVRSIPGVDHVVGRDGRDGIPGLILGGQTATQATGEDGVLSLPTGLTAQAVGRARAFLKVQEGCDSFCSYCIVPYARGVPVSAPLANVLENVDKLISESFHEIVLTGVHLGAYGRDLPDGVKLHSLVRAILERPGLRRLRISSTEPMEFDAGMMELLGEEKLCRHYHVPLQSGDDTVLESMGRGYTTAEYFKVVDELDRRSPGARLGADVIVGYPSEDEASFEETYRRIADSPLNHLHVFTFSPRQGTRAYAMGDPVPGEVKKARSVRLRELWRRKDFALSSAHVGSVMTVVVEDKYGVLSGLTDNYIRVNIDANGAALRPGSEVDVKITAATKDGCTGVVA